MIPVTVFNKRTVALFGLGQSGIASARALAAGGANVAAWDDSKDARATARDQGIVLEDLSAADWGQFAALVLAPGVPLTHPKPHWTVVKASESGVEVIGDTELFFRERQARGAADRVVAITGTNGKSTTSALTAHVLREANREISLGGNIGTAILDLEDLGGERIYVIEFSSYQIDLTPGLNADAAALLNISPDHLDRHGTLENYAAVKARIFSGLKDMGCAVIGVDDALCRSVAEHLDTDSRAAHISVESRVENGVFLKGDRLIEMRNGLERNTVSLAGARSLRGMHNAQNAAATFALALCLGLDAKSIEAGFESFPGLEHRMQEIGRLGRVLFVNDSKGTNADAAAHALASFDDIYWIAGGLAKSGGIEGLRPLFPRIRRAYLIGEAAGAFAKTLAGSVDTVDCGTMDKAVEQAARDAAVSKNAEPAVLLSPACASFDQYPSFMARGDDFRAAVARIKGVTMHKEAG